MLVSSTSSTGLRRPGKQASRQPSNVAPPRSLLSTNNSVPFSVSMPNPGYFILVQALTPRIL